MHLIPVLDIKGGVAVQAIGGERERYGPVRSVLAGRPDPLELAAAFRRLGLEHLYVADLDALAGSEPGWELLAALADSGSRLMVDAGLRRRDQVQRLTELGTEGVVLALESLDGPEMLEQLCEEAGPDRAVFSLDLRGGRPLGQTRAWQYADPVEIADRAVIDAGLRRLLVLDLAQVGSAAGVKTLPICRAIQARHPDVKVATGGGVRRVEDLIEMARCGLWAALVGSALHRGTITREHLLQLEAAL